MSRTPVRPYLINKDEEGRVRITIRETRFNSQGYPLISESLVEESFATATAARSYAKEHFGAEPGQFAAK
jgi:hypothetical protein